jgi:hypothetical protein
MSRDPVSLDFREKAKEQASGIYRDVQHQLSKTQMGIEDRQWIEEKLKCIEWLLKKWPISSPLDVSRESVSPGKCSTIMKSVCLPA